MADLATTKQELLNKTKELINNETNLEKMAYAAETLRKIAETNIENDISIEKYGIGTPGQAGFGVGAIEDTKLPDGWTKLPGHDDITSENYGNVLDPNGSAMVWIPKFYYKIEGNNIDISSKEKTGYVIHRAFLNNGIKDGFFVDKYGCSNVGGKFISKKGLDPCSSSSAHNPIGNLNNTPPNRHGGFYTAVKTRGNNFLLTSIFIYNALALLAYAHGQNSSGDVNCAFADVEPKLPKGNLVSALHDYNDTTVTFTASGYSDCALTGSGNLFAKTTHNGQASGVADLTGNMWEVASGFIKLNESDAVFKIAKETTDLSSIFDDNTASGSGGAYDPELYEDIDLAGIVDGNDGWLRLGNGTNQVFGFSTDTNSVVYKKTSIGIPLADGSGPGTAQFGHDGIYRYWKNELAPLVGGYWDHASLAGVFAMLLNRSRSYSNHYVGGRASFYC
jgi:hypothetical protein